MTATETYLCVSLCVYVFGFMAQLAIAFQILANARHGYYHERRKRGARLILSAAIWPVCLVLFLFHVVVGLVGMADFSIGKGKR